MLCDNKYIYQVNKKRKVKKRNHHEPVLIEFSTQNRSMTKKEMTKFGYAKKTNLYSGLVVTSFTLEALQSVLFLLQRKGTCTQGCW